MFCDGATALVNEGRGRSGEDLYRRVCSNRKFVNGLKLKIGRF